MGRACLVVVTSGVLAAAVGCSSTGGPAAVPVDAGDSGSSDQPGPGVSFANDVYPIVASWCAVSGCHDTGTTQNHLTNFSTPEGTHMRWVNGPGFDFCTDETLTTGLYVLRTVVVPGDPDASYLVWKITSTTDEPCQDPTHSRRMPPAPREPLAPASIETIVTWIREGALQN